jgi:cysteine desulfurase
MWANNETGVIFPVERTAELAHEKGILFHTDAVQAAGKIPIRLRETLVDMLSLSGHKLHGPKGVGVLYIKKGTRFKPWLIGGHQERNRRPGTENTPGIIGVGKACEIAALRMDEENTRVKELRDRLEEKLLRRIPAVSASGAGSERLPNTSNIRFEGIEGEGILLMLDDLGICVSTGSACASGSLAPSHVLLAMGIPPASAQGAIRFSLSVNSTEEEIDFVVKRLPEIVESLRSMSPLWRAMQTGR